MAFLRKLYKKRVVRGKQVVKRWKVFGGKGSSFLFAMGSQILNNFGFFKRIPFRVFLGSHRWRL